MGNRTAARTELEDSGVAILPGSDFGQPSEQLTARIAYVEFDGRNALAAAARHPANRALDDGFVREHCGRVVEAVERMCEQVDAE